MYFMEFQEKAREHTGARAKLGRDKGACGSLDKLDIQWDL